MADLFGLGSLTKDAPAGTYIPGVTEAGTPMEMLCNVCPIEKSLGWLCWIYEKLYWLIVELPDKIIDFFSAIPFIGWIVFFIAAFISLIIIVVLFLFLTTAAGALRPLEQLYEQEFLRAGAYVVIGVLMLLNTSGILPWVAAATAIGVVAFFLGVGILASGFLGQFLPVNLCGANLWVGLAWAIIMVLFAAVPIGILFPFILAVLALGPAFGLPWDWFEDTFNILLSGFLIVFIILCFYPSIIPGAESILKIFDYLLNMFGIYSLPC